MSIPWKNYIHRRRLIPVKLCRRHQIRDHSGLVDFCSAHGIQPPSEEISRPYFQVKQEASSKVEVEKVPSKKVTPVAEDLETPATKPDPPQKTTRKRARKTTRKTTRKRAPKTTQKTATNSDSVENKTE